MRSTAPTAPTDLQTDGRAMWNSTVAEYSLEAHHLLVLHAACVQLDRAAEARMILAAEGLFLQGRGGKMISHPAIAVELAATRMFRSLLRELGLDISPVDDGYSRPPTLPKYGPGATR